MEKAIKILIYIGLGLIIKKMAPKNDTKPPETDEQLNWSFPITLVALSKVLSELFGGDNLCIARISNRMLLFQIKNGTNQGLLIYNLIEEHIVSITDDWKDGFIIAKMYIIQAQMIEERT